MDSANPGFYDEIWDTRQDPERSPKARRMNMNMLESFSSLLCHQVDDT